MASVALSELLDGWKEGNSHRPYTTHAAYNSQKTTMTEDQKAIAVVLEILAASRAVPRTRAWIGDELRLAGRRTDTATLLESMERSGLIFSDEDSLGQRRYLISPRGETALREL